MLRLLGHLTHPRLGEGLPIWASAWTPRISGFKNIIIRGLFLGQTRKQMQAKWMRSPNSELGGTFRCRCAPYSTGMRVRLANGRGHQHRPRDLLLDEGIGAVDADFLRRPSPGARIWSNVRDPGFRKPIPTSFWLDYADRDMDDHGVIRLAGGIEEVVRAYEGGDAARHVREVLAETQADEQNVRDD